MLGAPFLFDVLPLCSDRGQRGGLRGDFGSVQPPAAAGGTGVRDRHRRWGREEAVYSENA